jgi:hypothetical protein
MDRLRFASQKQGITSGAAMLPSLNETRNDSPEHSYD